MTYLRVFGMDEVVTLFRGDSLAKHREVTNVGVVGRIHDPMQLQLFVLPPELQVHVGYDTISRHVGESSNESPYKSWSRSAGVAAFFATRGNTRPGLFLQSTFRIVEHHWWSTPSGWSHAYKDDRNRTLIPTGSLRTSTLRSIVHPSSEEAIRVLGRQDQEFLILGRVHAHELAVNVIQRRAA